MIMERKKILFCVENARQGGISKALESFLFLLNPKDYEIKIFCINYKDGPYSTIFSNYIIEKQSPILYALSTYYKEHKGIKKFGYAIIKCINATLKKLLDIDFFDIALSKAIKRISKKDFDVVIAFSEGIVTHYCAKITAPRKLAWVHLDYKRYLAYTNNRDETDIFRHYDNIIIPSKHCSNSFIEIFPQYKNKVTVLPNLLNFTKIKELSLNDKHLDHRFNYQNSFTIVSVGRICYEKQFFMIPKIAAELITNNVMFKWYIIGSGSKEETAYLYKNIKEYRVQDYVIPLGEKTNPYPYIKHSNLLAVTSVSETFCYSIAEAKVLHTPVIATNFGTAYEVLEPHHGIICDISEFGDKIYKIITNPKRYSELIENLREYKYRNEELIRTFNQITKKQ